jgi:hypothetical protein
VEELASATAGVRNARGADLALRPRPHRTDLQRSLAMKHAQEEVIHPRGHSNQVYARLRLDQGHPKFGNEGERSRQAGTRGSAPGHCGLAPPLALGRGHLA